MPTARLQGKHLDYFIEGSDDPAVISAKYICRITFADDADKTGPGILGKHHVTDGVANDQQFRWLDIESSAKALRYIAVGFRSLQVTSSYMMKIL